MNGAAPEVQAAQRELPAALLAGQQVIGDGGGRGDAGGQAVLRDVRQPDGPNLAGRLAPDGPAQDADIAAAKRAQPADGLRQLALAVAFNGGYAQNLPAPHRQGNPVDRAEPAIVEHLQVFHLNGRLALRVGAGPSWEKSISRPTIMEASMRSLTDRVS